MTLRWVVSASLAAVLGCSSSAPAATDAGASGDASTDAGVAPPDSAGDASASPSIGCDLPDNPGVMPPECVLYYDISPADRATIMAGCVSPASIVSSCASAGVVGICRFTGAAFGRSNLDIGFGFVLTGGGTAYEDEYRYMTTFGEPECAAAGGTWM